MNNFKNWSHIVKIKKQIKYKYGALFAVLKQNFFYILFRRTLLDIIMGNSSKHFRDQFSILQIVIYGLTLPFCRSKIHNSKFFVFGETTKFLFALQARHTTTYLML